MKFTNTQSFGKHLEKALPVHPSPVYGIALADPCERRFIIEKLIKKIGGHPLHFKLSRDLEETVFNEIDSPSFLAPKRVFILDDVDVLGHKEREQLAKKLRSLAQNTHLICAGVSIPFYDLLKKEIVLLDLSGEKTWKRQSRIKGWLVQEVHKKGKTISDGALAELLKRFPFFESLMREVEKLVTYTGASSKINLKAVCALSSYQSVPNTWELSESIIWGGKSLGFSYPLKDMQGFLPFLGQLRYHLQLGLMITWCLDYAENGPIEQKYPKLLPSKLRWYKQIARSLPPDYFKLGFKDLFELEIQVRMKGGESPLLGIDLFIGKLEQRRGDFSFS